MITDEYAVEGAGIEGVLEYDEDSYCVKSTANLAEFIGIDFEYFREVAAKRGWHVEMIPF